MVSIDEVKEFFADSRDVALSMAATHYGVDEAKLVVQEVAEEADVSGLGGRLCFLIWVEGAAEARPQEARDRDRGGRSDRGRDRDRDRGRGDRDRPRGGGGRGRDRGEARASDGDRPRGRGGRGRGGGGREERGDRPEGVDEERIEGIARSAAERVQRSGEAEILESMNSKERWVVHNFLKDFEGVTSASEGEGANKRVKVLPEA